MAIVSTGLTEAGVRGQFMERFNATPAFYPDVTTRIASTTETEKHRWLGSVPTMREWKDSRLLVGIRSESYDVSSLKYEATVEVDRVEIEDDQTGAIQVRINELAEVAKQHPDTLVENALNVGADETSLCYDGQPFFSDAHESGDSGAQSNILTPAMASTEPTTDEFRASIRAAIAAMMALKNDRGQSIRVQPSGLVIAVPPVLYYPALEAVNTTIASSVKNVLEGVARVLCMPGLTVATDWFLLKTDTAVRPLVFQDRVPLEFSAVTSPSDDRVFRRDTYLYGCRARYAVAYGLWPYAVRSRFTESG